MTTPDPRKQEPPRKRVRILQCDLDKKIALTVDLQGAQWTIDLLYGAGGDITAYPNEGEEWYITSIAGVWVLDRLSFTQNPSVVYVDPETGEAVSPLVLQKGDRIWRNPHGRIYIEDVYGVHGLQGPQGPQGQSIQGPQGAQGANGTQGLQGANGSQGTQGTQGATGTQGPQGLQGLRGLQGFQGFQGTQGTQGNNGTQGSQGNQGDPAPSNTRLRWAGVYTPGANYSPNDLVAWRGWYYVCNTLTLNSSTEPQLSSSFTLMAADTPSGSVTIPAANYGGTGYVRMTGGTSAEDTYFPNRGGVAIDTVVSSYALKVPISGDYLVTGRADFGTGSATGAGRRGVAVGVSTNGTSPGNNNIVNNAAVANVNSSTMSVSSQMRLTAGDLLSIYRYTDVANHFSTGAGVIRATLLLPVTL